ncbi:MAG TPA: glycosyltransferase family 39 protein [Holophagaceae bacterium]|nr:glycosyltransferase family 39 protein [Holophagaceae bacterium]
MPRRERWTLIGLWAAFGLLPLFLRPLWEPDEARYAEIPREMIAAGDWLTPRLNGVLYFEKPPLQYWLSGTFLKGFGMHAWAARLPLALAAGLVMWAAWRMAARLGARKPLWACVMALSCLLGFIVGQILTLDALFSAFLVAALAAAMEAVCARMEGSPALTWTLVAQALLAAAFLTKGPAAVVLAGGTLIFSLAFARSAELRKALLLTLFHPLGLLVLGVLTAPWFIAVNRANPGHADFFFIHEHWTRFTTHEHARQGSDNWLLDKLYFVPVLAAGLLPWLSHSVIGLKRGAALLMRRAPEGPSASLHRWVVGLCLLAAAWPFAFFSLSGSKLPPYILPAVVPLAALATTFEREGESPKALRRIGWELMGLGLLFFGGGFFVKDVEPGPWFMALALAFGLFGAWCVRPRGLDGGRFMMALASCMLLLTIAAQQVAGPGKAVDRLVGMAPRNAQWISFGQYYQGIPWLTGERCVVVAGTGELAYGRSHLSPAEQERWMPERREALLPMAQILATGAPSRPVWVLADQRDFERLPQAQQDAFEPMGRSGHQRVYRFR